MLIFERFEGGIAVLENGGEHLEVSREKVSADVIEGDVLCEKDGLYIPDKSATEKRREEITKKQNRLWS